MNRILSVIAFALVTAMPALTSAPAQAASGSAMTIRAARTKAGRRAVTSELRDRMEVRCARTNARGNAISFLHADGEVTDAVERTLSP